MIRGFKSNGLAELREKGRTGKIDANMQTRILRRLDRLDVIVRTEEMKRLQTAALFGPCKWTFEFEDGDAWRVDFEQYH